jgi:hypothetical protein
MSSGPGPLSLPETRSPVSRPDCWRKPGGKKNSTDKMLFLFVKKIITEESPGAGRWNVQKIEYIAARAVCRVFDFHGRSRS